MAAEVMVAELLRQSPCWDGQTGLQLSSEVLASSR